MCRSAAGRVERRGGCGDGIEGGAELVQRRAAAGGTFIQQPPQCFVPQWMLGAQEGQQLGLGDGAGASVVVAASAQTTSLQGRPPVTPQSSPGAGCRRTTSPEWPALGL